LKRILQGFVIVCLLLFFGGLGWKLYQRTDEAEVLSDRFSALSEEYDALSGEYTRLSGEYETLSGENTEFSQGITVLLQRYLKVRGHGEGITESFGFTESARALHNPNRGFYHMHGFRITGSEVDFRENVAGRFAKDQETSLALIQINLQEFREGDISEEGLNSLANLFDALVHLDKQLILRFLYDWSGKNLQYEPETLEVILRHMEQLSPILNQYGDRIFMVQGVFVGNNGEMHSSRHLKEEDMKRLAEGLYQATAGSTYLAVRTPVQWRKITENPDPNQVLRGIGTLASRMGLFNDGMLGSESDLGTYGTGTQLDRGGTAAWERQEEIAFQEILCKVVPNGGEVVIDNEHNDLENALKDMRAMHVTYLNRDYDTKVLDKWAGSTVREEGCFDGMDGLTYVERHLGYRLVLREAELDYDLETDQLTAGITLQNVGFAPVYREAQARLVLYDRERGREYVCNLETGQDIRDLAGGTEAQTLMPLRWEIPLDGQPEGELEVYFAVYDVISGEMILLGNEQDAERLGYRVGTLRLGNSEELWEQLVQELFLQSGDALTGEDREGNNAGN